VIALLCKKSARHSSIFFRKVQPSHGHLVTKSFSYASSCDEKSVENSRSTKNQISLVQCFYSRNSSVPVQDGWSGQAGKVNSKYRVTCRFVATADVAVASVNGGHTIQCVWHWLSRSDRPATDLTASVLVLTEQSVMSISVQKPCCTEQPLVQYRSDQ